MDALKNGYFLSAFCSFFLPSPLQHLLSPPILVCERLNMTSLLHADAFVNLGHWKRKGTKHFPVREVWTVYRDALCTSVTPFSTWVPVTWPPEVRAGHGPQRTLLPWPQYPRHYISIFAHRQGRFFIGDRESLVAPLTEPYQTWMTLISLFLEPFSIIDRILFLSKNNLFSLEEGTSFDSL